MIIVSVLIHILGNYFPKWTLPKTKQHIPLLKLSGLLIDFFVAFLILLLISLTSANIYIDNKDAVYGLEFNDTMQELGFKNGDKIISINNQPPKDVNKITIDIAMNPNTVIKINRDNNYKELIINDKEVIKILQSKKTPVKAKLIPNIPLKQTKEKFSLGKVLKNYQNNIKGAYDFISPKKDYKKIGGIRTEAKGFKENVSLLAFFCTVIGILNLLPLPGFSLGNFIISIIELKKRKLFDVKKKRIVCLSSVLIVVLMILYIHY